MECGREFSSTYIYLRGRELQIYTAAAVTTSAAERFPILSCSQALSEMDAGGATLCTATAASSRATVAVNCSMVQDKDLVKTGHFYKKFLSLARASERAAALDALLN